jgi:hypothetical protein
VAGREHRVVSDNVDCITSSFTVQLSGMHISPARPDVVKRVWVYVFEDGLISVVRLKYWIVCVICIQNADERHEGHCSVLSSVMKTRHMHGDWRTSPSY